MNRWSDAGMLTWERAQIDKPAFTPLAFAQLRVQTPGFVGFQSHFLGLPSFLSFVSWLFILIIICALPKDILCCFLGIIDKNLTRIPVFNNQPSSDSHTKGLLTAIPLVVLLLLHILYFEPQYLAMGACLSSGGGMVVSDTDKALHRQAEKELRDVSTRRRLLDPGQLTE